MAADPGPVRAGVLGSPVAHSLSPALHTAAYAAAGLTHWSYAAIEVGKGELRGAVAGLDDSWQGLSLTMPLKEEALALATEVSPLATAARAINTLVRRRDGGWDGDNTDVHGIVAALGEVEHGGRARVLGAGATARSAVLALRELRVERLDVAARRAEASASLVDLARRHGLQARTVPLAEWAGAAPPLVVSTVPVGAGPALAALLPPAQGRGLTLFDVVYAPWPSPLAAAVLAAGGRVVSGLEMLLHQAARQVELFTGRPADLTAMRAAVSGES